MPTVGRKAKPGKEHTQSVLLSKQWYSKKVAEAWVKSHGYYTDGLDETAKLFRFRQVDPSPGFRYRNVSILKDSKGGSKITLVIGYPVKKA